MKYEKTYADEYRKLVIGSAEASGSYLNTKFLIFSWDVEHSYIHDWHSFYAGTTAADFYNSLSKFTILCLKWKKMRFITIVQKEQ